MEIKKQLLIFFLAGLFLQLSSVFAENFELNTSAPADGELSDQSDPWDGEPDEVDALGKVAKVGSMWGNEYVGIFEFSIPSTDAGMGELKSAKLVLYSHSKGPSPATVELFAYWTDSADGVVSDEDWNGGVSLGEVIVEGETEISVLNRVPAIDVTDAVRQGIESDQRFIGFRLRSPDSVKGDNPSDNKGIIFRTAEFAENFPAYAPQLILQF
ncbi:hypothetical protein [Puniceicoccus vermicola]|uniref:DNRLRE domain-containing protein n=1 Tax=Puniceicoccus vermicola TaxID=388746 RepID=A0A7X1E5Z2_9BACT|nr:hypothetical protein [Puniceicoccus vermicola]MBC2603651.1 hypothetical protein [Puniceicoccus vermicola]